MCNKNIGLLILKTRDRENITQGYLAMKLGVSPQYLGRVEKGYIPISNRHLLTMAQLFKSFEYEDAVEAKKEDLEESMWKDYHLRRGVMP